MDREEVEKIFDEKIEKYARENQNNISRIPSHVHNGTDTGQVDANNLEFSVSYFKLFTATATPKAFINGAICSVNGVLYISDGVSWIKVGSQ